MSERAEITCQDCYFRRAELCALPGNRVCPTFRMAKTALVPPQQPRLVARAPQRVPVTAVA